MTINGNYIHAKGTPPDEFALMQRAVIHYNLAMAWAKERLEKGTGRKWKQCANSSSTLNQMEP